MEVHGFTDYFLSLRPASNTRNPWFTEYWEQTFSCRYPGSWGTPFNQHYSTFCTGRERLTRDGFELEAQLEFVSDAVMAFAHALRVSGIGRGDSTCSGGNTVSGCDNDLDDGAGGPRNDCDGYDSDVSGNCVVMVVVKVIRVMVVVVVMVLSMAMLVVLVMAVMVVVLVMVERL